MLRINVNTLLRGSNVAFTSAALRLFPRGRFEQSLSQRVEHAKIQHVDQPQPQHDDQSLSYKVNSTSSSSDTLVDKEAMRFDANTNISLPVLSAIQKVFKYTTMSQVQQEVLDQLPLTHDLLVRAKTGTGKTLAFLIAALEHALTHSATLPPSARGTPVLILAPTRELALQTYDEATKLLKMTQFNATVMTGGADKYKQMRDIKEDRCDLVIATPGRLIDFLQNNALFAKKVMSCQVLILDEVDRLLEIGFKQDIDLINTFLPTHKRTLLFSATMTKDTEATVKRLARPGYKFIDCVPANEVDTHLLIKQTCHIVPLSQQMCNRKGFFYDTLRGHKETTRNFKIIVFFPTKALVTYFSRLFNDINGFEVLELHSQLTQKQRSNISLKFRKAQCGILFTTDVSARGVDYPDVSLVLQFGSPPSRDQYIHRIGRTGRAGKTGEAIMILSPYERNFLKALKNIPIKLVSDSAVNRSVSNTESGNIVMACVEKIPQRERASIFPIWFSFCTYLPTSTLIRDATVRKELGISTASHVELSKEFSTSILGLKELPKMNYDLAQRLGVAGFPEFRMQMRVNESKIGYLKGSKPILR